MPMLALDRLRAVLLSMIILTSVCSSTAGGEPTHRRIVTSGTRFVDDTGRPVLLKGCNVGNWLLLVTGGDPTEDKPSVSFAAPADPDRVSAELIVRVDDCQAAYEELSRRGAEFLTPPVRWDHGEIRAFFRDPDGHLFEISELVE